MYKNRALRNGKALFFYCLRIISFFWIFYPFFVFSLSFP